MPASLVLPSLPALWQYAPKMSVEDERAAGEPPPVSVDKKQHVATDLTKAIWTIGSIQAAVLVAVIGAYFGIRGDIRELEHRVDTIEKWLKNPYVLPATQPEAAPSVPSVSTRGEDNSQEEPAPALSQEALQVASQPSKRSLPPNVKFRDPPVCISKTAHTTFACERATKCVGPDAFDPVYFRKLRQNAGLTDQTWAMVCEEKIPSVITRN